MSSLLRKNFKQTSQSLERLEDCQEPLRLFQEMVERMEAGLAQLGRELGSSKAQSPTVVDRSTQISLDKEEIQRLMGKPGVEEQEEFLNFNFQLRKLQER